VAEQSHKREMSEAVRGDFERLRARRQRRGRAAERAATVQPERIVLTPPKRDIGESEPQAAAPPASPPEAAEPPAPVERRSWVRSVLRRSGG